MKIKFWPLAATLISTSLLAQPVTNAPTSAPLEAAAPASPTLTDTTSNAPAAKPAPKKKKAARKPAPKPSTTGSELRTVPLVAGPAIVDASHVNVRGQAKINSEVITRMTNGEPVMVIEEVQLKHSGPEEPSAWAKIVLPEKAHVWVNSSYISADKTVKPKKLNLRGGPGENYSVLGVLHKGDVVTVVGTKGDWTELEAPTNAYAFLAAQYLKQEPVTLPVTPPPMETPVVTNAAPTTPVVATTTVAEAPPIASAPATMPPGSVNTPVVSAPVITNRSFFTTPETPATTATTATPPPASDEPLPIRIVQREGVVRGTMSIQAPTPYQLISADTGMPVDYLYTTSTNLDLSRYKGMHIIVSGEESLDERWKDRPIITIKRIQVID